MPEPRQSGRACQRSPPACSRACGRGLRKNPERSGAMKPFAIVTGGSGGIGSAIVSELRVRGWDVKSLSRTEGCDVSDEAQVKAAFADLDRLDALVNCAAVLIKNDVLQTSAAD